MISNVPPHINAFEDENKTMVGLCQTKVDLSAI
jgi:hypothetical protein